MKKICIRTVLCLLAAILLLTGCKSAEKTFHFNMNTYPETPDGDYSIITFSPNHQGVTNAEGENLRWSINEREHRTRTLVGNMECWNAHIAGLNVEADIWAPYSSSFTVQTNSPQEYRAEFGAQFNRNNFWVSEMSINGVFEGTLTLSDDNTMKLNGKHSHIQAHFWVYEEEGRNIKTGKYRYILDADAGENTQIRLEGDELIAEGIVGKYTVTKYEYSESSLGGQEIYTKVYNADS